MGWRSTKERQVLIGNSPEACWVGLGQGLGWHVCEDPSLAQSRCSEPGSTEEVVIRGSNCHLSQMLGPDPMVCVCVCVFKRPRGMAMGIACSPDSRLATPGQALSNP